MTLSEVNHSVLEESKRHDDGSSFMNAEQRLTTKEKVQKLKEDLRKRKAVLRGEIEELGEIDSNANPDESI